MKSKKITECLTAIYYTLLIGIALSGMIAFLIDWDKQDLIICFLSLIAINIRALKNELYKPKNEHYGRGESQ